MKTRFNTYDIVCTVAELQKLIGMRVNQVYDIDNKTYLIRLQQQELKYVLLLESSCRFHLTQYEWPKHMAPSGFTMKLRKHLKNKRLEHLGQIGMDRIIDLQFGTGEAAYHLILELYDRGNLLLTDYEWTILNVLRPHIEGDAVRFAVREKYPLERAKQLTEPLSEEEIRSVLQKSKPNESLKKVLNPHFNYGGSLLEHVLIEFGLAANKKVSQSMEFIELLRKAVLLAEDMVKEAANCVAKGYIIKKREERPNAGDDEPSFLLTNDEFHPYLFHQYKEKPVQEFESFDRAVDEFYSTLEGQKIDLKTIQTQREAMKKLQNVRDDHNKRLTELERLQEEDKLKAELIIRNQEYCNQVLLFVQTALAQQLSWDEVEALVSKAGGPLESVTKLDLGSDKICVKLQDPYGEMEEGEVSLSLGLTALGNANRYFNEKRSAATKQQKTIESQVKALKNAEKKTKQTLRDAQTFNNICKTRKTYWFEKFYWFISSDNYLVIAGRDQQQNEYIVKRHMKSNDLYVHADLSGASSVVIKCNGNPPPPKALHEAGQFAVAYSVAWEAKVVAGAWWVYGSQVSKTAPTGEYLSTGSFMIRGKKNYLPSVPLTLGFSFMFRLEDGSIERHAGERSIVNNDDIESVVSKETEEENEIALSESEGEMENEPKESKEQPEALAEKSDEEKEMNEGDDSSDEDILDTHIKVDHGTGKVVLEHSRTTSECLDEINVPKFPSLPNNNNRSGNKIEQKKTIQKEEQKKEKSGPKRGQKSKLKKIKEKYKDQDEEDREMALAVSKAGGGPKPPKRAPKKNVMAGKGKSGPKPSAPPPTIMHAESDNEPDIQEEETEGVSDELNMLKQLTGKPYTEDELLFAIPVIAPYSTLHDYKCKVKLTPGTGKRGKAAKTALTLFVRDKNLTPRERDLLKAVKDQDLARNFPGKVKISAPHLHK